MFSGIHWSVINWLKSDNLTSSQSSAIKEIRLNVGEDGVRLFNRGYSFFQETLRTSKGCCDKLQGLEKFVIRYTNYTPITNNVVLKFQLRPSDICEEVTKLVPGMKCAVRIDFFQITSTVNV
jgi:hypothetical protein